MHELPWGLGFHEAGFTDVTSASQLSVLHGGRGRTPLRQICGARAHRLHAIWKVEKKPFGCVLF